MDTLRPVIVFQQDKDGNHVPSQVDNTTTRSRPSSRTRRRIGSRRDTFATDSQDDEDDGDEDHQYLEKVDNNYTTKNNNNNNNNNNNIDNINNHTPSKNNGESDEPWQWNENAVGRLERRKKHLERHSRRSVDISDTLLKEALAAKLVADQKELQRRKLSKANVSVGNTSGANEDYKQHQQQRGVVSDAEDMEERPQSDNRLFPKRNNSSKATLKSTRSTGVIDTRQSSSHKLAVTSQKPTVTTTNPSNLTLGSGPGNTNRTLLVPVTTKDINITPSGTAQLSHWVQLLRPSSNSNRSKQHQQGVGERVENDVINNLSEYNFDNYDENDEDDDDDDDDDESLEYFRNNGQSNGRRSPTGRMRPKSASLQKTPPTKDSKNKSSYVILIHNLTIQH